MSSTAGQVIRCKGNIINSHLLRVFEFCSNFGVLVDLYKERISINLYIQFISFLIWIVGDRVLIDYYCFFFI